jgi:hypothetical protein
MSIVIRKELSYRINMFKNIFKKKSEIEKLIDLHKKILQEAHRLSSINRTESDACVQKASEIEVQIDALRQKEN